MEAGTWAEWAAAVATTGAVVAALMLPRWEHRHASQVRADERQERGDEQRKRDLDETRRMLYTVLLYYNSDIGVDRELAGTLFHSLSEHSRIYSAGDAFTFCQPLALGEVDTSKLADLITEICAKLGDPPPDWASGLFHMPSGPEEWAEWSRRQKDRAREVESQSDRDNP